MTRKDCDSEKIVNSFGYCFLYNYSSKTGEHRRTVIQDQNGYKYDIVIKDFIKTNGTCDFVSKHNPFSLENISIWLKINRPEFKLCEDNIYSGRHEKLRFYHSVCNDFPTIHWNNMQHGYGCGVCNGKQVGLNTSLKYLLPELAKEWHPIKNGSLTPEDVTCHMRKIVWWICPLGHEYYASIGNRSRGTGCKKCSDKKQESSIATILKQWFSDNFEFVDIEHKMFINPETKHWLRCDIYLGKPESVDGAYIEVHGGQHYIYTPHWHNTKEEFNNYKKLDKIKKNFAKKNGKYIEIDLRKIKTIEQAIEFILNKENCFE